jgi:hypothetical protein
MMRRRPDNFVLQASDAERARTSPAVSRRKLDPPPCRSDPDQRPRHPSAISQRPQTAPTDATQPVQIAASLSRQRLSDRPPQTQSP